MSDAPIVIESIQPRHGYPARWRVSQGEGEKTTHSTTHHTISEALVTLRALMEQRGR